MADTFNEVMSKYDVHMDKVNGYWKQAEGNVNGQHRLALDTEVKTHNEQKKVLHEANENHDPIRRKQQEKNVRDHKWTVANVVSSTLSIGAAVAKFVAA